ncbi:sensor domain-containing diguanylate cyclase [Paraburkholderia lycopersici]|uniref:PAS domain S-box-containing protein/diguanylate cyclase (GGDEF) domain-containing protein n=1 Tax=Paraburkholderia lycopersici TaxID=416944 RepID=A0A1G6TLZ6_9BURK|nr:diguanylate cyclase [Paraburkholderia lycopersici]SDD30049.1 PAS domain S-box-containing protein/diguanylate cyclase (GGDEF) domain-containing protein [Paraburkholderia lycopersici]
MTVPSPTPEAVPPSSEDAHAQAGSRVEEGGPSRSRLHAVAHGAGTADIDHCGKPWSADPLLDGLLRLVAAHFGVAAACLVPGDAPAGCLAGAGVDEALYEALRMLARAPAANDAREPLVVQDITEHPAWRSVLSHAHALPFRFVAAWPMRGAQGEHVGGLCLIDPSPRELDAAARASLADFARVAAALAARPAACGVPAPAEDEPALRAELEALRERERLLAHAIAGSGTGIWDRDVVTGEIRYSAGWKAMLGYAEHELTNRIEDSYLRLHPDDREYVKAAMQAHFEGRTPSYEVEHRIRCKDGRYRWICSRGKVMSRDAHGRALRMIGTTTDITSMREMAERLRESAALITNLTNEVPGLVFQRRQLPDGRALFSYASAGIAEIYELAPEQVAHDTACVDALIHPDDLDAWRASFETSAASLTPWHLEFRVQLPQQGLRWRQGDARPQRLADGATVWHGFITDATERKRIEAELQEFASTDSLTRLPNRRHFMARIEAQLTQARRGGSGAAVMMCDLDHFKSINDRWGHAIGDEVLRHFAEILRTQLRTGDLAGRIGGEEFAILLAAADLEGAQSAARRIQERFAAEPLGVEGGAVVLTVSIGITLMSAADPSAEAALTRSDFALYRAKKGGRNRIECA